MLEFDSAPAEAYWKSLADSRAGRTLLGIPSEFAGRQAGRQAGREAGRQAARQAGRQAGL